MRELHGDAIVIVKAAPQFGERYGETVCCAGIDTNGNWVRLYPVSFRILENGKKFSRWDRLTYKYNLSKDDKRIESRRILQDSIQVSSPVGEKDKVRLLNRISVDALGPVQESGKSLALLRVEVLDFFYQKKSDDDIQSEMNTINKCHSQAELFSVKTIIPLTPCPYIFKYRYRCGDGEREGTCQDWEIEATYFKWKNEYGEKEALDRMVNRFGVEYPKKGMALAMGTHSRFPTWLINGVIRVDWSNQFNLL